MTKESAVLAWCFIAVIATATATANAAEAGSKPPVLTPPDGYVESAPAGMHKCPRGMEAQVSRTEFRRFALRNQVWPQEDDADSSAGSWSAGRLLGHPTMELRTADGVRRKLKAEVYALVGGDGVLLDAIVTCTSAPAYNEQLLQVVASYRFEPSRYRGQGLNTMIPISFAL